MGQDWEPVLSLIKWAVARIGIYESCAYAMFYFCHLVKILAEIRNSYLRHRKKKVREIMQMNCGIGYGFHGNRIVRLIAC